MLKLRLPSTSSPTSTTTLVEEYDEIQRANIFPSVQEDQSVADSVNSCTVDIDLAEEGEETVTTTTSTETTSTTNSTDNVEELKAQVESLRQQLAERDVTVNQLQREMQEDRRAHEKLQTKWDLFFGTGGTTTTVGAGGVATPSTPRTTSTCTSSFGSLTPLGEEEEEHEGLSSRRSATTGNRRTASARTKEETTTPTTTTSHSSVPQAELQRINKHMEQLEAEKEACVEKAVRLSVALAESKATISTLESQVEEYESIIHIQNEHHSPFGFGRAKAQDVVLATESRHGGLSVASNNSTHMMNTTSRKQQSKRNSGAPPSSSFLPISDIQLKLPNPNQATITLLEEEGEVVFADDDALQTNVSASQEDESACQSLESASLGWSNRPLTMLSERGSDRGSGRRGSASASAAETKRVTKNTGGRMGMLVRGLSQRFGSGSNSKSSSLNMP